MSKSASLFTAADELSPIIGEELAKAFVEHRKSIKRPMTDYAAKLMAKRLREMPDPKASAEQSIRNGWSDVFAVKVDRQSVDQGARPTTDLDRRRQNLKDRIENDHGIGRQGSGDLGHAGRLLIEGDKHLH